MRPFPFIFGSGVSPFSAWNPSDKAANVVLSQNNTRTGNNANGFGLVRGTKSQSSGKYYFEFKVINCSPSGLYMTLGIAKSTASLSAGAYVGIDVNGYGYGNNGNTYNNGTSGAGAGSGYPSYTTSSTIMVAVDLTLGKLWFGVGGAWLTGSPGAGTTPMFSGLSGAFFPAASSFSTAELVELNTGSSPWVYTPPAGFVAWG